MSTVPSGPKADFVWMDGELVAWDDAKIHVTAHVIHYGSGVFEGCRVYAHPKGAAMFRMRDHVRRLFESARMLRMEIGYSQEEVLDAIRQTVKANKLKSCYVRPVVYRGAGPMGVNPLRNPVKMFIAVWEWGKYLGDDALTQGVDVCVSSFRRMAPNTHLPMGKVCGNYVNSSFAKMEALLGGFAEGILLDHNGHVSEGSGENVFLVRDGRVLTPPFTSSILSGITRNCVSKLCREMKIEIVEQPIPREMLYIADELFFSGTAAEVTPIRSVDRIAVANGGRGPITERLQSAFFDVVEGRAVDRFEWLEFV
ncbi:MAG TPA: branched-chain amino acid transaminase [Candidatus Krumholzibacteria bacterium]